MQLDFAARELTIKLVYYGPALSGKTTNLQAIHQLVTADTRGRLMTLDTRDDRTLFFDLLPLSFTAGSGLTVRLKLFKGDCRVVGRRSPLALDASGALAQAVASSTIQPPASGTAGSARRRSRRASRTCR